MKLIAVAMALIAFQCVAGEINFKGMPFGTSKTEFMQKYPAASSMCFKRDADQMDCCDLGVGFNVPTYADILPKGATACFIDERFESIEMTFESSVYSNIVAAMAAKFGKPRSSAQVVQNGFGARFNQITKTWHLKDTDAFAKDFSPDLDSATVMLMSRKYENEIRKPKPPSHDL